MKGLPYARREKPVSDASMSSTRFEVRVELKPGILDSEAETVKKSLALLGISEVRSVAIAKAYLLDFGEVPPAQAEPLAHEAVERLLANPVIHRVSVRLVSD